MELKEVFQPIINWINGLAKKESENSKVTARERLKLVLMQDRASVSPDFFEMMKKEIIEVIKKYVEIDEEALEVQLTRDMEDGLEGPALYANIPIKNIKPIAKKNDKKEEKKANEEIEGEKSEEIVQSDVIDNEENQHIDQIIETENNEIEKNNEDIETESKEEQGKELEQGKKEEKGDNQGKEEQKEELDKEEQKQEQKEIKKEVKKEVNNNRPKQKNKSTNKSKSKK